MQGQTHGSWMDVERFWPTSREYCFFGNIAQKRCAKQCLASQSLPNLITDVVTTSLPQWMYNGPFRSIKHPLQNHSNWPAFELCTLKLEKQCTCFMCVDVKTTQPSPATREALTTLWVLLVPHENIGTHTSWWERAILVNTTTLHPSSDIWKTAKILRLPLYLYFFLKALTPPGYTSKVGVLQNIKKILMFRPKKPRFRESSFETKSS